MVACRTRAASGLTMPSQYARANPLDHAITGSSQVPPLHVGVSPLHLPADDKRGRL